MDETRSASPIKRRRPDAAESDDSALLNATEALEKELECAICSKLLYEPVTTACGHTFCRNCLARALDAKDTCALCRAVVHLGCARELPVTRTLHAALQRMLPVQYTRRAAEAVADRAAAPPRRLPLFPLNYVVFPTQRFPMHIFEPRYRLMLRRVLAGSKRFGLIALRSDGTALADVGCVLEVTRSVAIADGRSMIDTIARERFRVLDSTEELDGYLVARTAPHEDTSGVDGDHVRTLEGRARELITQLLAQGAQAARDGRLLQDALHKMCDVPPEESGPSTLGLWLGGMLVTERAERQRLLEMKDAAERLAEMIALLEKYGESVARDANSSADSAQDGDVDVAQNRDCVVQ